MKKTHNKIRFIGKKYFLVSAFFLNTYIIIWLVCRENLIDFCIVVWVVKIFYEILDLFFNYLSQLKIFRSNKYMIDIYIKYIIFEKYIVNYNSVFVDITVCNILVINLVNVYFCMENLLDISNCDIDKKYVSGVDRIKKILLRFVYLMIVSLDYYFLTDYQLELMRRIARKTFGKRAFLKLFIIANKNILKRSNNVRMGGGKGIKLKKKVYCLVPGSRILELRGVNVRLVKIFKKKLKNKMSFSFRVVKVNRI